MSLSTIIGLLGEVPVIIDRDDARRAAEAELAKPGYGSDSPGLFQRALSWLGDRLTDLFHTASTVVPGGPLGLLVLLAVLVLVAVVVRLRLGRVAREVRVPGLVFEDHTTTARQYREAAERAFAAGDFGAAVRERFRALVRDLEERGVVDSSAGRTADEVAQDAGARLPDRADELTASAALFDAVHYGGRSAAAEDYRRLALLDERVRQERPVVPA
ncbi:DUF4129 domain-containing protein [Amycolatopsis rhizosphaerae]|uniref:DUF4129 domain-containing protein n=1 Tax=Amycolatopsis rhizosphaerae TaxID=2053003 RepID=UPI001FE88330|nr:DUF4129 domain-containing protein [Amycolatopsis rhizosphaerae]